MDDGFQNRSFTKKVSLILIDKEKLNGNGLCIPAGPLREPYKNALKRTEAIIVMGEIKQEKKITILKYFRKDIFNAKFKSYGENWSLLKGKKVIAFAGIGFPQKFFNFIKKEKIKLIKKYNFPDHVVYNTEEINSLINESKSMGYKTVTTEKDFVKLPKNQQQKIIPLVIQITIQNSYKFNKKLLHNIRYKYEN